MSVNNYKKVIFRWKWRDDCFIASIAHAIEQRAINEPPTPELRKAWISDWISGAVRTVTVVADELPIVLSDLNLKIGSEGDSGITVIFDNTEVAGETIGIMMIKDIDGKVIQTHTSKRSRKDLKLEPIRDFY